IHHFMSPLQLIFTYNKCVQKIPITLSHILLKNDVTNMTAMFNRLQQLPLGHTLYPKDNAPLTGC
ncbi:MAG: hypothetical protein L0K36_11885, partial [Lactiplantibacillus plantarum]|nr:hypothetical protein [Lactiplantibacillus plantarum]